jgi:hypothetical protein
MGHHDLRIISQYMTNLRIDLNFIKFTMISNINVLGHLMIHLFLVKSIAH